MSVGYVRRAPGVRCLFVLGVLAWPWGRAGASEYGPYSFTLRMPAAVSRLATYGDVAASGGASAASKWESGVNPASCAAQPKKRRLTLSGQAVGIWFEEGTRLRLTSEAVTIDAGQWGVFLPAIAQIRTNSATARTGLDFELEGTYYQLQWGKRVSETTAVGMTLAYSRSESRFKLGSADVTKADGPSYTARLGLLHEATEQVRVGLVCEYTRAPATTIYYDFMGLGIGEVKVRDTTHQVLVRPGISFEYKPDSAVYLDYQFAWFSDDTGRLRVHRIYAGIDHELFEGFYVRAGAAWGNRDDGPALTCGVGIYPSDRFSLDVGYQYDMFPELAPDFGRSHTVVASVAAAF